MYPDFKIRRAPSVYINGRKYVDPKSLPEELPRREQQSNFRLTIGTNKTIEPELRAEAVALLFDTFDQVHDTFLHKDLFLIRKRGVFIRAKIKELIATF